MSKRLTIVISEDVYEGLCARVGPRKIGQFLERLARPYVTKDGREASREASEMKDLGRLYKKAAQEEEAQRTATEWIDVKPDADLRTHDVHSSQQAKRRYER